jgi:hypothetical protein
MASRVPVLISGARAPVALHLAQLLVQAGHPVTLVDHLKYPIAAASRLGIGYHRIPPFTTKPQAAREALSEVVASKGIKTVIPTCEEALHLGAIWAKNPMGAELFAPDFQLLKRAHNKFDFIQLCDEIGLDTLDTHLLTSQADYADFAASARDFVFKPVWSRFGSNVLIRPDAASLRRVKPTGRAPWVAQSYASGTELCAYAVARQGRPVVLAAYRGLVRAGPGAAVCFEPADAETVRPFVERFIQATGWTGQVSFDLMRTDDGRVVPLECNPRSTSGLHFFTDGAAFARALFADGAEVNPDVDGPQSVRLALWLYGLPMMLQRQQRLVFQDALRRSGDVMGWPGDRVGLGAQLRSVAEFAGIALRHRVRLERASTWGIEWNGEG